MLCCHSSYNEYVIIRKTIYIVSTAGNTPCGADEIKALKEQYQAEEEQEDLEKMKEKRKN